MKAKHRILSLIITVVMILSMAPAAFAGIDEHGNSVFREISFTTYGENGRSFRAYVSNLGVSSPGQTMTTEGFTITRDSMNAYSVEYIDSMVSFTDDLYTTPTQILSFSFAESPTSVEYSNNGAAFVSLPKFTGNYLIDAQYTEYVGTNTIGQPEYSIGFMGTAFPDGYDGITFRFTTDSGTFTVAFSGDGSEVTSNTPPTAVSPDNPGGWFYDVAVSDQFNINVKLGSAEEAKILVTDYDDTDVPSSVVSVSSTSLTSDGSFTVTANESGNAIVIVRFYDGDGNRTSDGAYDRYFYFHVDGGGEGSTTHIGSSVGSDSGRSDTGGGGAAQTTPTVPANAPQTVTQAAANTATQNAVAAAIAAGSTTATANIRNPGEISLSNLQAMAAAASGAGMESIRLQADSMTANNRAVDVRITLNPALATQSLNLSGSTANTGATRTTSTFTRFFSNNIMTVSLGQQGDFGQTVTIAAKLISGLNTNNLVFYVYNRTANTYRAIPAPNYKIDSNGYVHFDTAMGGDIVISNEALARR